MWGRLPGVHGRRAGSHPVHRWSGTVAFIVSLPVALHCVWSLGFDTTTTRVLVHSAAGCAFYGAYAAKMLGLRVRGMPGWLLPVLGGGAFALFVLVWLTSAAMVLHPLRTSADLIKDPDDRTAHPPFRAPRRGRRRDRRRRRVRDRTQQQRGDAETRHSGGQRIRRRVVRRRSGTRIRSRRSRRAADGSCNIRRSCSSVRRQRTCTRSLRSAPTRAAPYRRSRTAPSTARATAASSTSRPAGWSPAPLRARCRRSLSPSVAARCTAHEPGTRMNQEPS